MYLPLNFLTYSNHPRFLQPYGGLSRPAVLLYYCTKSSMYTFCRSPCTCPVVKKRHPLNKKPGPVVTVHFFFTVPKKQKQQREEQKTSAIGLRCHERSKERRVAKALGCDPEGWRCAPTSLCPPVERLEQGYPCFCSLF